MTIIVFWYWWALALVFLVLEMLVSGFFFLWLAAAAGLAGLVLWLLPMLSTDSQLFLFAASAVLGIVLWRRYGTNTKKTPTDHPLLNKRGAHYIGRVFTVYTPIINGRGKIKVDDSLWLAQGEDCDQGTQVKVIAVHGTVFKVEQCNADKTAP